jgi:hypothetical protein
MLADPVSEYLRFPAALAFLSVLPAKTALRALESRAAALADNLVHLNKDVEARIADVAGGVDRIFLVEIEYQQTMWESELAWIRDLVEYLKSR